MMPTQNTGSGSLVVLSLGKHVDQNVAWTVDCAHAAGPIRETPLALLIISEHCLDSHATQYNGCVCLHTNMCKAGRGTPPPVHSLEVTLL